MNEKTNGREVKVGNGTVVDASPKYGVVYQLPAMKNVEYPVLRKIEKRINEREDEIADKGKGFVFYLEDLDVTLLGTLRDDLLIISHIEEGRKYE
jgi:hypothetical protein